MRTCSADNCDRAHYGKGFCKNHYRLAVRYGKPSAPTTEDKFWAKVNKTESCWLWTAYLNEHGYGQVRVDNKAWLSHRLAYVWATGTDPKELDLDHICHNPACVNPSHLRLATRKQNMENHSGPGVRNSSGALGVYWNRQKQAWQGEVVHNGRKHYAGRFSNVADADAAVTAKRNELFTRNDLDRAGKAA